MCCGAVISHPFFWSTAKKLEVLAETLHAADAEPGTAQAERLFTLEVIGGTGWRRRVSAGLIKHLYAYPILPSSCNTNLATDAIG